MPIVPSAYTTKSIFKNGHFSTIFSAKIRMVLGVEQVRERVELADGDFVDIDWSFAKAQEKAQKVCIFFHGLEGNAQRPYILGQVRLLVEHGYDCAAVNLRGCSGEGNRHYHSYNSGATDDVGEIVDFMNAQKDYAQLYLCGFSLGGNLILKYLGEERQRPDNIVATAAISTPVHLHGSLLRLSARENWIYRLVFLKDLRKKYRKKMPLFPDRTSLDEYKKIRSLLLFDELYTAPAHGFKDAMDYYTRSSSVVFLPHITVPSLLLNAQNDSFLDEQCYPYNEAKEHPYLYLEVPEHGGHVGFFKTGLYYYNESRTLDFFEEMGTPLQPV